jgi:hypothetical protein
MDRTPSPQLADERQRGCAVETGRLGDCQLGDWVTGRHQGPPVPSPGADPSGVPILRTYLTTVQTATRNGAVVSRVTSRVHGALTAAAGIVILGVRSIPALLPILSSHGEAAHMCGFAVPNQGFCSALCRPRIAIDVWPCLEIATRYRYIHRHFGSRFGGLMVVSGHAANASLRIICNPGEGPLIGPAPCFSEHAWNTEGCRWLIIHGRDLGPDSQAGRLRQWLLVSGHYLGTRTAYWSPLSDQQSKSKRAGWSSGAPLAPPGKMGPKPLRRLRTQEQRSTRKKKRGRRLKGEAESQTTARGARGSDGCPSRTGLHRVGQPQRRRGRVKTEKSMDASWKCIMAKWSQQKNHGGHNRPNPRKRTRHA